MYHCVGRGTRNLPLIPSGKIDKNELKTLISLLPEEENYHITLESWRRNNTGGTPNCRSWQHLPPPKPWAEPRGCAAGWASPRGPRRAQTQRKPSNKEPENQAIKNQHFVCRGSISQTWTPGSCPSPALGPSTGTPGISQPSRAWAPRRGGRGNSQGT